MVQASELLLRLRGGPVEKFVHKIPWTVVRGGGGGSQGRHLPTYHLRPWPAPSVPWPASTSRHACGASHGTMSHPHRPRPSHSRPRAHGGHASPTHGAASAPSHTSRAPVARHRWAFCSTLQRSSFVVTCDAPWASSHRMTRRASEILQEAGLSHPLAPLNLTPT